MITLKKILSENIVLSVLVGIFLLLDVLLLFAGNGWFVLCLFLVQAYVVVAVLYSHWLNIATITVLACVASILSFLTINSEILNTLSTVMIKKTAKPIFDKEESPEKIRNLIASLNDSDLQKREEAFKALSEYGKKNGLEEFFGYDPKTEEEESRKPQIALWQNWFANHIRDMQRKTEAYEEFLFDKELREIVTHLRYKAEKVADEISHDAITNKLRELAKVEAGKDPTEEQKKHMQGAKKSYVDRSMLRKTFVYHTILPINDLSYLDPELENTEESQGILLSEEKLIIQTREKETLETSRKQGAIIISLPSIKVSKVARHILYNWTVSYFNEFGLSIEDPKTKKTFDKALQHAYRRDKDYELLVEKIERIKKVIGQKTQMFWGLSAIRTSVLVNGVIQFLTVIAFWFGFFISLQVLILIILIRSDGEKDLVLQQTIAELPIIMHHKMDPDAPYTDKGINYKIAEMTKGKPKTKVVEFTTRILNASSIQGSQDSMRETLDKCCVEMREEVEIHLEFCRYIAWLIPSIGFVGTVMGIGDGLLSADRMVNAPPATQGDEIATVTGFLGMAFDTTLVALLLSIIIVFMIHCIQYFIEHRIVKLKKYCYQHLIEKASFV